MSIPVRGLSTILSVLLIGLLAPLAAGQDVWRIAGSMNGWNPSDTGWALAPQEGKTGAFRIEREIPAGTHTFKFVRNGSWEDGHLGVAGDGTLEQPGGDLIINVRARGVYQIELDTSSRTWTWRAVRVLDPVLEALVRGVPMLDEAFLIDCSRSLTTAPLGDFELRARVVEGRAQLQRVGTDRMELLVRPERAGPLVIELEIEDENETLSERVEVDVSERWRLRERFVSQMRSYDRLRALTPVAPGVHRGLVWIKRPGTLTDLEVRRGDETVAAMDGAIEIAAGRYVIEIRDGRVTRMSSDEGLPDFLLAGEWTEFEFTPADGLPAPRRVFLTGDFNGWAQPDQEGAIELASVATGAFRTLVDLPVGAHQYGYLTDEGRFVPDMNNPDTARDASDRIVSLTIVGSRAEDFPLPRPNAINAEAVRHDPESPMDIVTISRELGLAEVSFSTLPDDARGASLLVDVLREDGSVERTRVACRRERDGAGFDRFSARVMSGSAVVRYAIALSDGDATWVSDDFEATLDAGRLEIPDWAKGAVWYQIFAERFRNGNPLNDPRGAHVYQPAWTDDWYAVSAEELEAHRVRYQRAIDEPLEPRTGGDLFHVVWDRRYGGDLQGVVEKLDYLKDLGVDAIYFNPVFEGSSMHKYDATDFRHIDDNFGTPTEAGRTPERFEWPSDPSEDPADPSTWAWSSADRYFVDVLLPEAKRRGIRVVIDGVWNHTGRDFWAFVDVQRHGAASAYAEWFFADFDANGALSAWRAWDGPSGWLPKFRQTESADLVGPVKDHIFAVTERWMDPDGDGDPSDGVDGWRLDVPLDIGLPFWVDWRAHVKAINPDAVIIAEIWSDAGPYMRGEHFDTQMHYPFAMPVLDWLAVRPERVGSDELGRLLRRAFDEAPETNLIHQNLFASHDTDRYVSMLYNPGRNYDQQNRIQDGDAYRDTKPDARTYELSIVGVAIQATYLGAPMVYYGDELGMWGADDPTDRKPMSWPDVGPFANEDDGPDLSIHRAYSTWFNLRHDPAIGPVLRFGDVEHLDSGSPDLFAFQRSLNGLTVRVVANRSDRTYSLRRLDREGLAPESRIGARSAMYWVIRHDRLEER